MTNREIAENLVAGIAAPLSYNTQDLEDAITNALDEKDKQIQLTQHRYDACYDALVRLIRNG